MAKIRQVFICSNCGNNSPKWEGKCVSCGEWNSYQEEIITKATKEEQKAMAWNASEQEEAPVSIAVIQTGTTKRIATNDLELNRVLGGGIVSGSLVLLGGEPGIGKSTLLLQVALQSKKKVLYISGEESKEQIKMRATRLGFENSNCHILTETNTHKILQKTDSFEPDWVVVDSIQTLSSPNIESMPGSISQIRETAGELQRFAKSRNVPILIIGHINKEGNIAGPKLLEHIVDTVLQFEGDRHHAYRIVRTIKNRFGSTDEMGIYEMRRTGLRQINNPSELLIAQRDQPVSGSSIAATMEGQRPMLIETQALVSKAIYGTPQRSATGFDLRRLSMLLAVLEKRCGLYFGQSDVFLNIAGGIRVDDPAIDLAIVAAMVSSLNDIAIADKTSFAGEIGLTGEIRAVNRIEQRIQEADKLGFQQMFIPAHNMKGIDLSRTSIKLMPVKQLKDVFSDLFS